jgi:NADH dehydrogenase
MTGATIFGVEGQNGDARDFPDRGFDVVTGAFSYSGAAIARELERSGRRVRTLTGHAGRADPGTAIDVRPLDFDDIVGLSSSLEGATTLYNTYWVRFPHGQVDHERAVANSRTLFHAARHAGVERIVHVSITHPSISSPYGYFRGKAHVERALAEAGVPYAVLRPGILFGGDGVLINNIAWLLRHLPVFGVGGKGDYRIRPVHIDDLAGLAVAAGAARTDTVVDAVGPERPTFLELVGLIREAVGSRSLIVRVPGFAVPAMASLLGLVLRDVLLTGEEFRAMADGMADTDGPATGTISVSDWIREQADTLGRSYANEIERHFRHPAG